MSFKDAPGDRGTEIHVILDRDTPAGVIGEAVQKLLGHSRFEGAVLEQFVLLQFPKRALTQFGCSVGIEF